MSTFDVSFEGVKEDPTFLSALTRGTDEGKVVKVSANKTVALCSDGDNFIGVVKTIDKADKAAVVQINGFVTVGYSVVTPTIGFCELDADGAGGVSKTGSVKYWVVDVDTSNTKVTFWLG